MKENLQLLLTLVLSVYIICITQCKHSNDSSAIAVPTIDTVIQIDTIHPSPIYVELPPQAPAAPTIIYIDSSRTIVQQEQVDTSIHHAVSSYKDSLSNDELTIYHESIVDGELLGSIIGYKLHVPKTIEKTVEITKPYPAPVNAIFLTGGLGTDFKQLSSLNLGLQFVSAQGWSAAYEYDLLQDAHHAKIGIRLFQFNNSKKQWKNRWKNKF